MLNDHKECQDVGARPPSILLLHEVLAYLRVLLKLQCVHILKCTDLPFTRISRVQKHAEVDGDSDERDDLHDLHPVADAARTDTLVATAVPAHQLEFELETEQVGEEREDGSEGEGHGEEADEAHLDDRLVVVVDERGLGLLHADLPLDLLVHFQIGHAHMVVTAGALDLVVEYFLDPILEEPVHFSNLVSDGNFEPVVLSQHKYDLLEDHDGDKISLQLLEVLPVENVDERADVRINELEAVDLDDNRIL